MKNLFDECDVVNCSNQGMYEIEEEDGGFWRVCEEHSKGKDIVE
jgi:hypothetical protein